MMNSPWAAFTTFVTPQIRLQPCAIDASRPRTWVVFRLLAAWIAWARTKMAAAASAEWYVGVAPLVMFPYRDVNSAPLGPYQSNPAAEAIAGVKTTLLSHWDGPVTLFETPGSCVWKLGSVTATRREMSFGGQPTPESCCITSTPSVKCPPPRRSSAPWFFAAVSWVERSVTLVG